MEEFQESDVLWAEEGMHLHHAAGARPYGHSSANLNVGRNAKETAPITIPSPASTSHHRLSWKQDFSRPGEDDSDGGGKDEDNTDMVPPHVLVARRLSGKMAFSVYKGQGRTLKGRDLSQVRNSILRLTGFLEA